MGDMITPAYWSGTICSEQIILLLRIGGLGKDLAECDDNNDNGDNDGDDNGDDDGNNDGNGDSNGDNYDDSDGDNREHVDTLISSF